MAMAQASLDGVADDPHSLPVIAQKRLLDPVSDTARRTLDAAFEEFAGRRQDVLETLLGSAGERAMFRQVYPFSPALCMRFQRVRSTLHLVTSSRAATPTSWCAATPPPAHTLSSTTGAVLDGSRDRPRTCRPTLEIDRDRHVLLRAELHPLHG
jgi:hypothetical protein